MKQLLVLVIALCLTPLLAANAAEYGVAVTATPVLNTPDFKAVFGGARGAELKTDRCGQVRELEYIALPGTVFTILKKLQSAPNTIYQVATDGYTAPPNTRLYIDSRFLRMEPTAVPQRQASLPSHEAIASTLKAAVGNRYVWGGNVPGGVPELPAWFYKGIREEEINRFILAGLDCSGLLYHATNGLTPRNTAQLLMYGQGVTIAGKSSGEIPLLLQPLDLIVWNGHVVIVLDQQSAIESRLECSKPGNGGVVITPLSQRIAEIMRTRHPVNAWPTGKKLNDIFVVRRWYDESKTILEN
ncbi:MAG: peptidoglycan endopeptidase [Desulfuromonadaceae bacterium]